VNCAFSVVQILPVSPSCKFPSASIPAIPFARTRRRTLGRRPPSEAIHCLVNSNVPGRPRRAAPTRIMRLAYCGRDARAPRIRAQPLCFTIPTINHQHFTPQAPLPGAAATIPYTTASVPSPRREGAGG